MVEVGGPGIWGCSLLGLDPRVLVRRVSDVGGAVAHPLARHLAGLLGLGLTIHKGTFALVAVARLGCRIEVSVLAWCGQPVHLPLVM
jgi:hypothetical protein